MQNGTVGKGSETVVFGLEGQADDMARIGDRQGNGIAEGAEGFQFHLAERPLFAVDEIDTAQRPLVIDHRDDDARVEVRSKQGISEIGLQAVVV